MSVTRSPRPIGFGVPAEIAEILLVDRVNRTDAQRTRLADYYIARQKDYIEQKAKIAKAKKAVPPDAESERLRGQIAALEEPLPVDPKLARLRRAAELSKQQIARKRLIAAQDVAWALINTPEFLYNH